MISPESETRARLDAIEAVLRLFMNHSSLDKEAGEELKAAILQQADGLRSDPPNEISKRQADLMEALAMAVPRPR